MTVTARGCNTSMALITETLEIPEVAQLFPSTRRRRNEILRPCGTSAARRRHQRRKEKCPTGKCVAWWTLMCRLERTKAQLAKMEEEAGKIRPKNPRLARNRPRAAYQRMSEDEYAELQYESLRAAKPF